MSEYEFQYVFGPVVSRRLGRSLGVDVVPFKTCVYDCVYCQLGRTTHHTLDLAEYVPLETLLDEVRRKVAGVPDAADYITIAGSGEPTLYARLAELIAGIKAITAIPIAVITNGALLWDPRVQTALLDAELIVPSLDAGDAATFSQINSACQGIDFNLMLKGLAEFRARYTGQFWLEIFLVGGITDTDDQVAKLASAVARIRPDRVQLNTVSRPTPGSHVVPVTQERLEEIAQRLGGHVEVIAHFAPQAAAATSTATARDLLDLIRRHPCTLEEAAQGLGLAADAARRHADDLIREGRLREEHRNGAAFLIADQ